jgi:hypothetical protein
VKIFHILWGVSIDFSGEKNQSRTVGSSAKKLNFDTGYAK